MVSNKIEKGWGYEHIWVNNAHYCSKFMHFNQGSKFSMHFHSEKIETWYVLNGQFIVSWIDTKNADMHSRILYPGDVWHNDILQPHQVFCEEEGTILEVSTTDSPDDNYRVLPGDSQK